MLRSKKSRILTVLATAALSIGLAVPAAATPPPRDNDGLIEINLVNGNTIQVPLALAANICGVTVNALAADLGPDGEATCTADADGTAEAVRNPGQGQGHNGNNGRLIEINLLNGNTIQVPLALAANVCGVTINVLAADLGPDGAADCKADADGTATVVKEKKS
jgi:hypothetical protein